MGGSLSRFLLTRRNTTPLAEQGPLQGRGTFYLITGPTRVSLRVLPTSGPLLEFPGKGEFR